jgi:DNA-directed RNA polymerase beta' subunit
MYDMNSRFQQTDAIPFADVKGIQFSIPSAEDIRRQSVVHVTSTDLYEKSVPKVGGLYDLTMGTTDKSLLCQTCKSCVVNCQGHFGHIELAFPIYNICYIKQVYKILQCICMRCSDVLLTDTYKKMYPDTKRVRANLRFKRVYETIKKQGTCHQCQFEQPKWTMDSNRIDCTFPNMTTQSSVFTAKMAFSILRKITDANCTLMGFHPEYSHPKNMIFKVLPVSPPVVRPSVMMDPTMRTQDDLTHKLIEIIKSNQQVEKCLKNKSPANMTDEHLKLLQYHVNTLIDNDIPGQPQATQRTGRPIKSVCQRIKSKEGRVRGNLMGKRVDFSARTVITAEPNIHLDELGVPESIARNLTYSETVTLFNRDFLQKCVDNGPEPPNLHIVGANFVTKGPVGKEQRKDLRFAKAVKIEVGDTVERHLMDGDYVVFNRQPTLHRMSMMGHRVKVMKGKTFRLNLSVCSAYNADFDGDEMNLFLPCTHDARAEVKELMMVSKNIVSPQANRPVMGVVQDALLASSKLTRRDVFITKDRVMNIMYRIGIADFKKVPIPCILKPVPLWSGKQVFSLVMPKKRYLALRRNTGAHEDIDDPTQYSHCFADTEVVIQDGELLSGILCKKSLGTSSGGIVHKIWTEGSHKDACDFISNVQYVCNAWLVENGFSVGISDCVFDQTDRVETIVAECIREAHQVIENNKNTDPVVYEPVINNILNKARDTSGRFVQKQMTDANNLYSMVSGGSKGSVINIAQIMACVGQQNVNGQRIAHTYEHRTLPHFKKHDNSPESRGFIQHSYMQGLQPHEFFFHAMGGREGVIDTAIKTSDSGYTQRRLVKAMEDVTIMFDGTVRNSLGDILQFKYGEDGMDGSMVIQQGFRGKSVWLPLNVEDSLENADHVFGVFDKPNPTLTPIFNEILEAFNVSTNDPYVLHRYNSASITPGEMVGVIAAQSLGQPITQLVLNTFHAAGISAMNVTLGVPRLKELMNVSKNIRSPSMQIVPIDDTLKDELCGVFLRRFIKYAKTVRNYPSPTYEREYIDLMEIDGIQSSVEQTEWAILYDMDTDRIDESEFDIIDITTWINKSFNYVWCSSSCDQILVRLFPANNGYDNPHKIKQLSHKISTDTTIQGFRNITQCVRNGEYIETNGSDLVNILADERVNPYRTRCNDVINVFNVLGIEAARQVLVDELKKVIEFDGTYVDYRHVALLVDTMTYKGSLMAITRHGINRTETGVLMRCSFEETVNVLTEAAVFAEVDLIKGVTEHIIMGKTAKIGTGSMDVLMDVNKFISLQTDAFEPESCWRPSSPSTGHDKEIRSFFPNQNQLKENIHDLIEQET